MAQKEQGNKLLEELGKWCLDVSKYTFTAVIISAWFNEFENLWALSIAAIIIVAITMSIGIVFMTIATKGNKNNKQNKKKIIYGTCFCASLCLGCCNRDNVYHATLE